MGKKSTKLPWYFTYRIELTNRINEERKKCQTQCIISRYSNIFTLSKPDTKFRSDSEPGETERKYEAIEQCRQQSDMPFELCSAIRMCSLMNVAVNKRQTTRLLTLTIKLQLYCIGDCVYISCEGASPPTNSIFLWSLVEILYTQGRRFQLK